MKVVFNPTNERLSSFYAGKDFVIEAYPQEGCKKLFDDACANHLLNKLGPRGLCSLEYGDEGAIEAQKAEDGIARNLEFKRKQVIQFNQLNEANKIRGVAFIHPPEHVKRYAEEIGVALLSPYAVSDSQSEKIAGLEKQNQDLVILVANLTQQVTQLVGTLKTHNVEPPPITQEEVSAEVQKLRKKYDNLKVENLKLWVMKNIEDIKKYPEINQREILLKWTDFYADEKPPFDVGG